MVHFNTMVAIGSKMKIYHVFDHGWHYKFSTVSLYKYNACTECRVHARFPRLVAEVAVWSIIKTRKPLDEFSHVAHATIAGAINIEIVCTIAWGSRRNLLNDLNTRRSFLLLCMRRT